MLEAEITIKNNTHSAAVIGAFFEELKELNSPTKRVFNEAKFDFETVVKSPGEIIEIDFDYYALEKRICDAFNASKNDFTLNSTDTELLVKCSKIILSESVFPNLEKEMVYSRIPFILDFLMLCFSIELGKGMKEEDLPD